MTTTTTTQTMTKTTTTSTMTHDDKVAVVMRLLKRMPGARRNRVKQCYVLVILIHISCMRASMLGLATVGRNRLTRSRTGRGPTSRLASCKPLLAEVEERRNVGQEAQR